MHTPTYQCLHLLGSLSFSVCLVCEIKDVKENFIIYMVYVFFLIVLRESQLFTKVTFGCTYIQENNLNDMLISTQTTHRHKS